MPYHRALVHDDTPVRLEVPLMRVRESLRQECPVDADGLPDFASRAAPLQTTYNDK